MTLSNVSPDGKKKDEGNGRCLSLHKGDEG